MWILYNSLLCKHTNTHTASPYVYYHQYIYYTLHITIIYTHTTSYPTRSLSLLSICLSICPSVYPPLIQYESGKRDQERVLTAKGREQAEATGERLKVLLAAGTLYPIDKVYYSTMARVSMG